MVELGVGKNMVRSIRFWIEATGMATPSSDGSLCPTWLGDLLFRGRRLDPYMEDIQTLWLIHWNLCTHVENPLFAWEFLFSRWQEPEFTEANVLKALSREAENQSKKLSHVTLQQHLQVFLHTYVPTGGRKADIAEDNLDCPLTELEMLVRVGDREDTGASRGGRDPIYVFRREEKPSISQALFSYCVHDFWRKAFPNEQTLSARSLVTAPRSPGQVFKIPEEAIYARLEDLHAITHGTLRYSESAMLRQVQRTGIVNPEKLLTNAYH